MTSNISDTPVKKKRILYLDALRALAIITVILYHVGLRMDYAVFLDYGILPSFNWFLTDFYLTCARCGVDIFLMLSGALSLGRVWDIRTFLGKRIPRIVAPFLFWLFTLLVVLLLILLLFPHQTTVFAYYYLNVFDPTNVMSFLAFLGDSCLGHNKWFGPYWFFWMIMGTYLIMPIFNKWIYNSSMKEVEYFLVIWLVTCLFDKTLLWDFPVKLTYFTGPIGMVVLGYYLRYTERKFFNDLRVSIALTVISMVSLIFISYLMSDVTQLYIFNRYSILLAIEVVGIFTLYKNIDKLNLDFFNGENSIFRKVSFSIAKYSYGIYLVHQFIMNLLFLAFIQFGSYKLMIVVLPVGSLCISWALLAALNRIPYVNNVIGAK